MTTRTISPAPTTTTDDPGWPYAVLDATCARLGVDPAGAHLIKFTNNAVFALATAPYVVRVAGSDAVARRAPHVVAVATWLASHGMPTVRLVDGLPQPLDVRGHAVTVWHAVPDVGLPPTGQDMGRIARRFHALPGAPADLPVWDQLGAVRTRLHTQDVLTDDERRFLEDVTDELEAALPDVALDLEPGPIHGDVFAGNLVAGPDGPVLCDFDGTCTGPREWDLTPAAVGRLRFRYPIDYHRELAAGYGYDVLRWPGFPAFRRVRELQLVTSVLPVLRSSPRVRDQWRYRFETFRAGDLDAVWTTYA